MEDFHLITVLYIGDSMLRIEFENHDGINYEIIPKFLVII